MLPNFPGFAHSLARLVGRILITGFIKPYRGRMVWLISYFRHTATLFLAFLLAFCSVADAGSISPKTTTRESIRVVMDDNYPPYIFRAPDGTLEGILVDQWALWEKKTGIRVLLDAMDWAEAQRHFLTGEYDVIDTIFENEQRKTLYDFSAPYARIEVPIFFNKELTGISGPKDLVGFVVGAKEGDNSVEVLRSSGVTHFTFFRNYEAIIAAARDGKIKVFTVDQPPVLYYLIKMGIQDQFRATDPLYTGEFHRAVRNGDKALLAEVQQGFNAISKGEYEAIDKHWYGTPIITKRGLTITATAAEGAIGFLGLLLLWVWMLRRSVRLHTTDLKRLTQLYAAVTHVNQAMVRFPVREALLNQVCKTMVEHGPFRMVWIGWNDPQTHEVRVAAQYGDTSGYLDGIRIRSDDTPLGQGPTGMAIRDGQTHVANHFLGSMSATPWHEAAAVAGFASAAAIPIRNGGEICGALVVYAGEKNFFGVHELELLEGAAEDVSFTLAHLEMDSQRRMAEEALRGQEERYRTFFEYGPDGVLLQDPSTLRPIEFNNQVCRQLGYTREEFQTLTLADIEARESPEDTARTIKDFLERGITDFETQHRTKHGEIRDVRVIAQHIQFGGVNVYHCVWRDITDRKRAEQELLKSERFLREAQLAGGVGCFSLNINLGIWESSETFDAIFGIGPDYPRDTSGWLDLVAPNERVKHQRQLQDLIQGKGRFDLEFMIRRMRDGQERWVTGQGSLEYDSYGQTTRLIGTMLDITERKLAEAEILRLNQELEQRVKLRTAQLEAANKELEAFSYSVSHDLRTPLQNINGFSEIMMEEYQQQLDEKGRHYLSRIQSGTKRMGQIIDDLLRMSRIDRTNLKQEVLDFSGLCQMVLDNLRGSAPDRQVNVSVQPGMRVQADPSLMHEVLENLLSNAWKFTSKRQEPEIEVGKMLSPSGEQIFFIRDNGAGFDMAHADKLFNAFQRLHATTDFEGTGIGLAIVQRIIHRHGGRIWAEGEVGKGATFFFRLSASVES